MSKSKKTLLISLLIAIVVIVAVVSFQYIKTIKVKVYRLVDDFYLIYSEDKDELNKFIEYLDDSIRIVIRSNESNYIIIKIGNGVIRYGDC